MPIEFIKDLATKGKKSPAQVEKMWSDTEASIKKSNPNLKDEDLYKRVTGAVKSNLGVEDLDEESSSLKVVILKNSSTQEYRVPGPKGTEAQAYYTDDKDDAIGTAKDMYGTEDITITFRTVSSFDKYANTPIEETTSKMREYHSYSEWKKSVRTLYPMSRFGGDESDDTAYVGKPDNVVGEWNGEDELGIVFSDSMKESIDILDKIETLLR